MSDNLNEILAPAELVMFHGNVNISGRNGNNLEASRDGCELWLHLLSGGVLIAWGGAQHYVPAVSVMSVTLSYPIAGKDAGRPETPAAAPASPSYVDARVADKVLEEFSEGEEATPKPTPKRPGRARG